MDDRFRASGRPLVANPDAATQPKRKSFAQWLAEQPPYTGPERTTAADEDEGPRPGAFARAYAQYIRETWPEKSQDTK